MTKMFLWRALNNLLPTKTNLYKRGVIKESLCPICGLEEETISHALWDCTAGRDVLGGSLRRFQKATGRGLEFHQIFMEMEEQCDSKDMDTFSVIARRIWLRMNSEVHGTNFTPPNQLVRDAIFALEEFWS